MNNSVNSPVKDPAQPLFLAKDTYRQRRITDGARLLPIVGFLALCLPLFWTQAGASFRMMYLFGVWLLLIAIAAFLSKRLRQSVGVIMDDDAVDGSD